MPQKPRTCFDHGAIKKVDPCFVEGKEQEVYNMCNYRKYPRIRRTFFHRGKNQKLGVRLIRRYSPGLPHATCGPAVVDSPMLRHVRRVTFDRFARKFGRGPI